MYKVIVCIKYNIDINNPRLEFNDEKFSARCKYFCYRSL